MFVQLLNSKYQSLVRLGMSLDYELDAWVDYVDTHQALEKNFSQISAIATFMRVLSAENKAQLDSIRCNDPTFLKDADALIDAIIKIRSIWDFFRSRIETRLIPFYRKPLLVVDLVTHDYYKTIMRRAAALDITRADGYRDYPLTGLQAQYSASTWRRHRRPIGLQNEYLPLPVIDLPWEQVLSPWDLSVIAHEVGHDIDYEMGGLTPALRQELRSRLGSAGATDARVEAWSNWASEMLADAVALLLCGPAFVMTLTDLLMLPHNTMTAIHVDMPHPPHYLRVMLNTEILRTLGSDDVANSLQTQWRSIYGAPHDRLSPYLDEIAVVADVLLNAPLQPLTDAHGHRYCLRDLIRFDPEQLTLIEDTAARFTDGRSLRVSDLPIRHVISAAKLAANDMVASGAERQLSGLATLTQDVVRDLAPPGQLAAERMPEERLANLARSVLAAPLTDYGFEGEKELIV